MNSSAQFQFSAKCSHWSSIHSTLYIEHDQPQFLAARQRVNYTQSWGADPHSVHNTGQNADTIVENCFALHCSSMHSVQCAVCSVQCAVSVVPCAGGLPPNSTGGQFGADPGRGSPMMKTSQQCNNAPHKATHGPPQKDKLNSAQIRLIIASLDSSIKSWQLLF